MHKSSVTELSWSVYLARVQKTPVCMTASVSVFS